MVQSLKENATPSSLYNVLNVVRKFKANQVTVMTIASETCKTIWLVKILIYKPQTAEPCSGRVIFDYGSTHLTVLNVILLPYERRHKSLTEFVQEF